MANPTLIRRHNALALFRDFAERALAAGTAPKGLEQSFATRLQISPSMWSQIKASRPIGDKLARQIEKHCGQSTGWLDGSHATSVPTAGEAAFIKLASAAWWATNSAGRKALRQHLQAIVAGSS